MQDHNNHFLEPPPGEVTESGYKERLVSVNRTALERPAIEGDSPVYENAILFIVTPKYRGTRGTLREPTGTIR